MYKYRVYCISAAKGCASSMLVTLSALAHFHPDFSQFRENPTVHQVQATIDSIGLLPALPALFTESTAGASGKWGNSEPVPNFQPKEEKRMLMDEKLN